MPKNFKLKNIPGSKANIVNYASTKACQKKHNRKKKIQSGMESWRHTTRPVCHVSQKQEEGAPKNDRHGRHQENPK